MSLHNVNHNNLKAYIIGSSSLKEFEQIIAARNTLGTIQNVPLFEFDEVDKYLIDPRRWNL